MFVYLPSCNFTAGCPEASERIKRYMEERPNVRIAGCCRPEQQKLTPDDKVLTLCLFCASITQEVSPETGQMSIWEYLLQDKSFPWPDYGGEAMVIRDCRRARNNPVLLDAVRSCMERMNITPVELADNREASNFDGVWPFNPVPQRNLDIAPEYFGKLRDQEMELLPQEEQRCRMEEQARQYTTKRVVCYCPACLKGVRLGGADGIHLMELVTGVV